MVVTLKEKHGQPWVRLKIERQWLAKPLRVMIPKGDTVWRWLNWVSHCFATDSCHSWIEGSLLVRRSLSKWNDHDWSGDSPPGQTVKKFWPNEHSRYLQIDIMFYFFHIYHILHIVVWIFLEYVLKFHLFIFFPTLDPLMVLLDPLGMVTADWLKKLSQVFDSSQVAYCKWPMMA